MRPGSDRFEAVSYFDCINERRPRSVCIVQYEQLDTYLALSVSVCNLLIGQLGWLKLVLCSRINPEIVTYQDKLHIADLARRWFIGRKKFILK